MTHSILTEVTNYPESDDRPMADNTLQFRWIVTIKENLEILFGDRPDVFIAGDLLWYPVEGNNRLRQAPDVLVVLGRPKGDRGSYRQWEEDNIPPQVVFEILSPGNRLTEMYKKFKFYERYGVQEYYLYDPRRNDCTGWQRSDDGSEFVAIEDLDQWLSPHLGIRFQLATERLRLFYPDGREFLESVERERQARDRIAELEAKLREAGIDPNSPSTA
ncbi:MAG: Uma2 family endonuclease [Phormidium sp. BM_Day4_Bin.17]|nr:Uma2 family endonuclease [Phormidium sp. BM_Day4_Bin.17]UCJ11614.1 MAG: Uma2 family endonuclease [Phormidium sp. PBR-2020]